MTARKLKGKKVSVRVISQFGEESTKVLKISSTNSSGFISKIGNILVTFQSIDPRIFGCKNDSI